ncbi:CCA tRNA nucleotidyltransferase [Altericroceibacterium spongiae]|uniref:CCA tRNA nucleotidyltransferase n=1 Tax=Altericroceibacterium spongiae TaxID=2320269 RepID=A0A420EMH8_9SPHN|nr:CCA tRNA nucleotidyltransferase [Altericroceibacterium spongiae]RKF21932.1 CCA tRNA nucleotidyltransferase [Altericroceibacterium spongiae]
MTRLPAADWTQRHDLAELVACLGPDRIRYVGGAVRDTLLRSEVEDVDCATTLLPEDVLAHLKAAGIRAVPTGIEHGTITAVMPLGNVEITTLRKDVATDGRRATVTFASEWADDAARRDFTINALYAHPETREISDYFGGLKDLEQRRIRFIGDARQRIREDHLRILRYYRFQARFGSELDKEAEEACTELAQTLKGLSRERVAMELLSLLRLPDPSVTIRRMFAQGVLSVILPETGKMELTTFDRLIDAERENTIPAAALRRLGALLPPERKAAEMLGSRLRLSREQRKRLICIAQRQTDDAQNPRALAYRHGRDCAIDRLLLLGADCEVLKNWDIPQFPLKGGEIVQRGVAAGPEVARILQSVQNRWVEEGFPDRRRVQAILEEELA